MTFNGVDRQKLIERVMRPRPANSHIVDISTPVISFGDLYKARVVSLGINPSVDEFMSRHKPRKILTKESKRLVDYQQLGIEPGALLTKNQAELVLAGCFNYFNQNPYHWFNRMEEFLVQPSGVSYFDGSAAHLDLVQWATDPVWQSIPSKKVANKLIDDDKDFLVALLEKSKYEKILLNGSTVLKTVASLGIFSLEEVGKISYGKNSSLLLAGKFGETKVLATTLNIPAAHGLDGPTKVAEWLRTH